jgi:hypothetical protein
MNRKTAIQNVFTNESPSVHLLSTSHMWLWLLRVTTPVSLRLTKSGLFLQRKFYNFQATADPYFSIYT